MTLSIVEFIANLKISALNAGFTSVDDLKINLDSSSDTLLPKLFIKTVRQEYDKQNYVYWEETTYMDLVIVSNDTNDPLLRLLELKDDLLQAMFSSLYFKRYFENSSIILMGYDVTNERDMYSVLGGESATLRMKVLSSTVIGGKAC